MKSKITLFGAIVGMVFMVAILVISILIPCPKNFTFMVVRIILAISLGAFASVIPGFIELKYRNLLTAGGALGVFALVYLIDPGKTFLNSPDCEPLTDAIHIEIFIDGHRAQKNLEVTTMSETEKKESNIQTDGFGSLNVEFPHTGETEAYKFNFRISKSLDTVVIMKLNLTNFRNKLDTSFYLQSVKVEENRIEKEAKLNKVDNETKEIKKINITTGAQITPEINKNTVVISGSGQAERISKNPNFILFGSEINVTYSNESSQLFKNISNKLNENNVKVNDIKIYDIPEELKSHLFYPSDKYELALAIKDVLSTYVKLELRAFKNIEEKTIKIVL